MSHVFLTKHFKATESDHKRNKRKRDSLLRTVVFFALIAILGLATWAQSEPEYADAHRVGVAIAKAVQCQ